MILPAAPIIRQPQDIIGAPGKTDFVRIYIASELNKSEYRTTLRHEQAHVWAAHNRRRPKDAKHELWAIACEMEIARTIYDQRDIENINAPRSRLAGGYVPDSIDGLPPGIDLAEDIYEWLVENHKRGQTFAFKCCACDHSGDSEDHAPETRGELLASIARQQLDSDELAKDSQIAADSAYALIRNRQPTLTHAVDAALRVRIERERSHRRPSRRNTSADILLPGAVSRPRPPLVEIFVDRSGSFSPAKTCLAESRLKELLARYGATIRSDVWFFGDDKLSSCDLSGGGNTPYGLISQHLEKTRPKLAIVITDDDPVSPGVCVVESATTVLCVPIGCATTQLARVLGGVDVAA
jgi:hypothetical protein